MRFIWFWTFWHWSKDSFESGALLRSPIHGIGGHWDEWLRHDASASDRDAIEAVGRTVATQRAFVRWLVRRWSREAHWHGTHPPIRFILGQLAQVAPFDRWAAFERYRGTYGIGGLSAIVLSEGSEGESSDVRVVEALALPADADSMAPGIVTEGFEADGATLATSRRAAMSLLAGRGLLTLLALWTAAGRRPYSPGARTTIALGWLIALAIIVGLLVIPEPGEQLTTLVAVLVTLWIALSVIGLAMAAVIMAQAWRLGREWRSALRDSQIRLRMNGGLQLHGGSAGLPFCLSMLTAIDRAHPSHAPHSWLWRRVVGALRREGKSWAATGVIGESGRVESVILEPKVRALVRQTSITDVLLPWQPDGDRRAIAGRSLASTPRPPSRSHPCHMVRDGRWASPRNGDCAATGAGTRRRRSWPSVT